MFPVVGSGQLAVVLSRISFAIHRHRPTDQVFLLFNQQLRAVRLPGVISVSSSGRSQYVQKTGLLFRVGWSCEPLAAGARARPAPQDARPVVRHGLLCEFHFDAAKRRGVDPDLAVLGNRN